MHNDIDDVIYFDENKERNRYLIKRYPYLLPRNVFTDKVPDDYNYSYIEGVNEIPYGWTLLFLQLCEDIRQPLIDANYLDKFRFTQIKEKYNRLCCYISGAPDEVHNIIRKYEYVSLFICHKCGQPARYETRGWFASFCEDCIGDYANEDECEKIKFDPIMKIERYRDGEYSKEEIDVSDIWERLYKERAWFSD